MRRLWVLFGSALLFIGTGLAVWNVTTPVGLVRNVIGSVLILMGTAAFLELAER